MLNLYLDTPSGIAGDMTVAALTHLGAPLEPLRQALRSMGLENIRVETQETTRNGISCLSFQVKGMEKHSHYHRTLDHVVSLVSKAEIPAQAKDMALDIFEKLAQAEGAVHARDPADVTFHEVGAIDSITDIVGVSLAIYHLAPKRISASIPVFGTGVTKSQHGAIPVPSPASVAVLKGIPTRGVDVPGELTTPTGAAILATIVDQFGPWPAMKTTAIGYGAGSREYENRPNILRAVLGEGEDSTQAGDEWQVDTNIDDMNPELFEYLMEKIFEAGANDVWFTPVHMKKHRPAITVSALCDSSHLEQVQQAFFMHSSTIGLRFHSLQRRKLARSIHSVDTPWGPVRIKLATEGQTTYSASPEYDDCKAIASKFGIPLDRVYSAADRAWQEGREKP